MRAWLVYTNQLLLSSVTVTVGLKQQDDRFWKKRETELK